MRKSRNTAYLAWKPCRRKEFYQMEEQIRELCVEKLRSVIEDLTEADAYLLYLLFFEEVTVKEAAQLCGCSRKTIANRRKRILKELNKKLKAMGIMGGYF